MAIYNAQNIVNPTADSADNNIIADVIGRKDDTTSGNSIVSLIKTVDGVVDAIKTVTDDLSSESAGTLSYLDAGGEQTIVEITPTTRKAVKGIWLELDNMIKDGTVKFYYKIDGTNYRELTQYEYAFVVLDADDFLFLPCDCYINHDFKVTYTEDADEGAARDIPYSLIYENLEA